MKKVMIDINCDMGESFGIYRLGEEEQLLDWVTSANVACGLHAGDPSTMRRTVAACIAKRVAIGAHPGLPDLVGFGRRELAITPDEAYEITLYQIGALDAIVRSEGGALQHVKPHGALYHMAETKPGIAEAIVKAVAAFGGGLAVYGIAQGRLTAVAEQFGIKAAHEAFADRTYQSAGKLSPRTSSQAVISDPHKAAAQALLIASQGCVTTLDGERVPLKADSLCIHSDTDRAADIAQAVHRALLASS